MKRHSFLSLALLAGVLLVPAAGAAGAPGAYTGVSSGMVKNWKGVGGIDRGTVSFSVQGNKVLNFRSLGQLANCGGHPAEMNGTIKQIVLDASGKGKGSYSTSFYGRAVVSIAVTSSGTASGALSFGGTCGGKATFTAKRATAKAAPQKHGTFLVDTDQVTFPQTKSGVKVRFYAGGSIKWYQVWSKGKLVKQFGKVELYRCKAVTTAPASSPEEGDIQYRCEYRLEGGSYLVVSGAQVARTKISVSVEYWATNAPDAPPRRTYHTDTNQLGGK